MQTWVWLSLYVLGFVVLQVYLYRYFIGQSSSESGTPPAGLPGPGALNADGDRERSGGSGYRDVESFDPSPPEDLEIDEAVRCSECGAYNQNDRMFVYCRHCGVSL